MSRFKYNYNAQADRGTNPREIWCCDHDHHSSSRCEECFPSNKKYISMNLKEALEMIQAKKQVDLILGEM